MNEISTLNYEKVYEFRFAGIPQEKRESVWAEISPFVHKMMGSPQRVLDPAAGRLEFLRFIPAAERWGVDLQPPGVDYDPKRIHFEKGNIFDAQLPESFFDGTFLSNFLEHLSSPDEIARLLTTLRRSLRSHGKIAIMGPNFKYCAREYFDCSDHRMILTEVSVSELLHATGFRVHKVIPRFLPYSFRGKLPPSPALVKLYLQMPFAWRFFGKQFLVIGEKN